MMEKIIKESQHSYCLVILQRVVQASYMASLHTYTSINRCVGDAVNQSEGWRPQHIVAKGLTCQVKNN